MLEPPCSRQSALLPVYTAVNNCDVYRVNTILTFLECNRQRLELERYGASTRLSYVVVTQQFQTSSCVVFLILAEGKPDPVLVVKVPRLAGASASVEREVANLWAVQATRPGGFDS